MHFYKVLESWGSSWISNNIQNFWNPTYKEKVSFDNTKDELLESNWSSRKKKKGKRKTEVTNDDINESASATSRM